MKTFVYKILRVSPIIVLITIFNYVMDPYFLFDSDKQDKMVSHLIEGNSLAFSNAYNQHIVKSKYIENQSIPMEVIILGTSRSNQIGSEWFQNYTFYNACLNGNKLKDILGIWHVIEENNPIPKMVVLEVSSNILQISKSVNRKWLTKSTNKMLGKLDYGDLKEDDPILTRLKLKFNNLFSIQYGMIGLNDAGYKVWTQEDTVSRKVLFADGSEKAYRGSGMNKKRATVRINEKLLPIDDEAMELNARFIQYLLQKGIKVVLFVPPFNPAISEEKRIDNTQSKLKTYLHELEEVYNLEVIGGVNPNQFQLKPSDYTDWVHFERSAMKQLFTENYDYLNNEPLK